MTHFVVIEREVKRSIAMDADAAYRKKMHAALDRAMDAAEVESGAEPHRRGESPNAPSGR